MAKMKYLVIHCTDSPYTREIIPDDLWKWHLGPKKNSDGTFTFMSMRYDYENMKDKYLKLPSGKKVKALTCGGRGWKQVGYSDLIQRSGNLINLVPYTFDDVINSYEITNGASGYNSVSRHVVLAGGWTDPTCGYIIKNGIDPQTKKYFKPEVLYTPQQIETLLTYIEMQVRIVPSLIIVGHNQLAAKTCPNFDVNQFLKDHKLLSK